MRECPECHLQLADTTMECPRCGKILGPQPPPLQQSKKDNGVVMVFVVIAILVVAMLITAVVLLVPFNDVSLSDSASVPWEDVDGMSLTVTADIADLEIVFEDIDMLCEVNVTMEGGRTLWGQSPVLDLEVTHSVSNDTVIVNVDLDVSESWKTGNWVETRCHVTIDESLVTDMDVVTAVGSTRLTVPSGVTVGDVDITTTTGSSLMTLSPGSVLSGNVSVISVTGGAELDWDDVNVTASVSVDVMTTTGNTLVDIMQHDAMTYDVDVASSAVTGGTELRLDIVGDIGATIGSSVNLGSIDAESTGFSGPDDDLVSENHPASGNFEVTLDTTTGGVAFDAEWRS